MEPLRYVWTRAVRNALGWEMPSSIWAEMVWGTGELEREEKGPAYQGKDVKDICRYFPEKSSQHQLQPI
jgi:hypothetical protein